MSITTQDALGKTLAIISDASAKLDSLAPAGDGTVKPLIQYVAEELSVAKQLAASIDCKLVKTDAGYASRVKNLVSTARTAAITAARLIVKLEQLIKGKAACDAVKTERETSRSRKVGTYLVARTSFICLDSEPTQYKGGQRYRIANQNERGFHVESGAWWLFVSHATAASRFDSVEK